jgi:GDPmannose 4,6-dehydratase
MGAGYLKTCLVTGVTGQDGILLARLLSGEGYTVYGGSRQSGGHFTGAISGEELIELGVKPVHCDLSDPASISESIKIAEPEVIFHLGGHSFAGAGWRELVDLTRVNALGTSILLKESFGQNSRVRFVNCSSAEIFGKIDAAVVTEQTTYRPQSHYALSKHHAHMATQSMRKLYGMWAANAILFNHESPHRQDRFVTRKIVKALCNFKRGSKELLHLGNLDASKDWGAAREYARALFLISQCSKADDYIIATGKLTSVRQFVSLVARALDLDLCWEGSGINEKGLIQDSVVVCVDEQLYRPFEKHSYCGDPTKIYEEIGWKAEIGIESLAQELVDAEMEKCD